MYTYTYMYYRLPHTQLLSCVANLSVRQETLECTAVLAGIQPPHTACDVGDTQHWLEVLLDWRDGEEIGGTRYV